METRRRSAAWLFTAVEQKMLAKERHVRREKRDPRREVPLDGGASAYRALLASIARASPAAMGRSEDSVRNLLHRALAALAEALDREQPAAE